MTHQNPAGTVQRTVLAAIVLVALVGAGCSKKLRSELIPNQPPQVLLTAAPAVRDSVHPEFYAYNLQWKGYDPDGRVDHYIYAVDPIRHKVDPAHPNGFDLADTCWHTTVRNAQTFFFSAGTPIVPVNPTDPRSETAHTFAILAVDNEGGVSKRPAERAFFSFTQAPDVRVSSPLGSSAFTLNLTPSFTVQWTGTDPDGQFSSKPVRWVFRLFGKSNPDFPLIDDFVTFAQVNPDSLRSLYAPDFPGWRSVGADTTSFQYTNLGQTDWLFVVTGFDEAGAYDPVFASGKNMMPFSVIFANSAGPKITMFSQFFSYTYETGGFDETERRWFKVEVPADLPVTFNWTAEPAPGADIQRYRWGVDLLNLSDDRARTVEADWREKRWSAWRRLTTAATIGPFSTNGEVHFFYIEAEDNNSLLSLGIIAFTVVRATFDREVLIVDDTRFRPDQYIPGTTNVAGPVGAWPNAAELDTFLFAKGGVPWVGRTAGTLSTPGIFAGYSYDTIGTRGTSLDGVLPLSLLGRYRHVIWYVDETSASYTRSPSDAASPITALRTVNSPRRPATLATYLTQAKGLPNAGFVWLCGGGAAFATLLPWNKAINGINVFTREAGELQEGRLMFDYAHWREYVTNSQSINARKFGTTFFGGGVFPRSPGRGWPANPPLPTPPAAPSYTRLPVSLDPKATPPADPLPPGRIGNGGSFYLGNYGSEHILTHPSVQSATYVREDYGPDADHPLEYSTLDTLYLTLGSPSLPNCPNMTYYHGRECQPFIFSGFNIWYWKRQQCIDLVDWVLQDVWGLTRTNVPREPAPRSSRRAAP